MLQINLTSSSFLFKLLNSQSLKNILKNVFIIIVVNNNH